MARGRRGRRSDYSWFGVGDVEDAVDAPAVAQFGSTGASFLTPGTLVRVRGRIGVTMDAAAVNETALCLFGLVIV